MDDVRRRVYELGHTLCEAGRLIAADLRSGNRQRALALLGDWADGMNEVIPYAGAGQRVVEGLAAVNHALEHGDFVGVADALSHVVVPELESWLASAAWGTP